MNVKSKLESLLEPQDPQNNSTLSNKFSFFKKQAPVILMIITAFILLIPFIIFLVSTFKNQAPSQNQQVAKEADLFKAPYVADELIVQLKEEYTLSELERLKRKFEKIGVVNQEKAYESDAPYLKNYYLLKFKSGTDLKKVVQELEDFEEIESFHPNFIFEANEIPNDNLYPQMWGLTKIDMPGAWNLAKGSNNVKVAVIDTGLNYNHEDFQGRNIILGKDFAQCSAYDASFKCTSPKARDDDPMDNHGHGTHVSGTIAAVTNNSIGVAGIDWNVTLVPLRALGAGRNGDSRDIIDALQYAIDQQVDVVNMSIGAPFPCNHSQAADYNRTIADAVSRGIVVVVAAGNDGDDAKNRTPASCDGVITVGSSDANDKRASTSNWGSRVDISAPGVGIYSTILGNSYRKLDGTSMAAPHVAGVVALLLSLNPNLTPDEVRLCLVGSADPIQTDRPIGPRLNAYRAITSCTNITPSPTTVTPSVTVSPSPASAQYEINGVIFVDTNGNKIKDLGEPGYPQAQIVTEGGANLTTTPDSNGNFIFPNVPSGTYTVSAVIGGVKRMTTSPPYTFSGQGGVLKVTFYLSPEIVSSTPPVSGEPSPSPVVVIPTVFLSPTRAITTSPTPVTMYTCREDTKTSNAQPGSIKMGSLICEPN